MSEVGMNSIYLKRLEQNIKPHKKGRESKLFHQKHNNFHDNWRLITTETNNVWNLNPQKNFSFLKSFNFKRPKLRRMIPKKNDFKAIKKNPGFRFARAKARRKVTEL